jgi:glycolate oxidase iron-sulfur subunit
MDSACALARRNVAAFAAVSECDYVVTNSAGCGAALREQDVWLGEAGAQGMPPVRDVCELLDEVGLRAPPGRVAERVCYDDPCHLVHGQGVAAAPRNLLRRVPGLELAPHEDAAACCGAAGTYNLTHPEMSAQVLGTKLDHLAAADPDLIATGNPGCMLQLRGGAEERGLRARVVHPIEILAQAYRG